MSITVQKLKKLMWANENEMPAPKMALSKGVIMLGNMPSQYTGKFVPVFLCRWMSMVNASVG